MKRVILLFAVFFISGCLVRTYTIEKPRTDLEIKGNRGYLVGSPKEAPKAIKKKTRPHTIFEIEFGAHTPAEFSSISAKEDLKSSIREEEEDIFEEEIYTSQVDQGFEEEVIETKKYTTYKVHTVS